MRPKVAFIGTGGTIASIGKGPLNLQDYGANGKVMHADEIVAHFPETALVADVVAGFVAEDGVEDPGEQDYADEDAPGCAPDFFEAVHSTIAPCRN